MQHNSRAIATQASRKTELEGSADSRCFLLIRLFAGNGFFFSGCRLGLIDSRET